MNVKWFKFLVSEMQVGKHYRTLFDYGNMNEKFFSKTMHLFNPKIVHETKWAMQAHVSL